MFGKEIRENYKRYGSIYKDKNRGPQNYKEYKKMVKSKKQYNSKRNHNLFVNIVGLTGEIFLLMTLLGFIALILFTLSNS